MRHGKIKKNAAGKKQGRCRALWYKLFDFLFEANAANNALACYNRIRQVVGHPLGRWEPGKLDPTACPLVRRVS